MNPDFVDEVLRAVQTSEPYTVGSAELVSPMVLRSEAKAPVTWELSDIENALGVKLPQENELLWSRVSELRLNEDVTYGQWGCILWSPVEVVARHKQASDWRGPDNFRAGDVIIGEFRGDTDLVVLRCDPSKRDYGKIVIALAIDPGGEWPFVASSITDFVLQFLSHTEKKFWEP
jgi:hypothetical protein